MCGARRLGGLILAPSNHRADHARTRAFACTYTHTCETRILQRQLEAFAADVSSAGGELWLSSLGFTALGDACDIIPSLRRHSRTGASTSGKKWVSPWLVAHTLWLPAPFCHMDVKLYPARRCIPGYSEVGSGACSLLLCRIANCCFAHLRNT